MTQQELDALQGLCDGDVMLSAIQTLKMLTAMPALLREVRRLQYYEAWARRIAKLPCCNDCADTKTCDKKPKWGDVCAINCPLWRGPAPDDNA